MTNLQTPFPLEPTREYARAELVNMLDMMVDDKLLVIDSKLTGILGLIADSATLAEHGVVKSVLLKTGAIQGGVNNPRGIVYIVRNTIQNAKLIAEQIRLQAQTVAEECPGVQGVGNDYFICCVPRMSVMMQRVLEEEGVWEDSCRIGELDFGLVPLEDDFLSMEMPNLYRDVEVMGDTTGLFYTAKSLMRLQLIYGTIPLIRGKGEHAKQVTEFLDMLRGEIGDEEDEDASRPPMIDELIIVDRATDMISPMLTPRTYEGLIDELYMFENGVAAVPASVVLKSQNKFVQESDRDMRVKVPMRERKDELFKRLRDLGLPSCKKALADRAVELTRMKHQEGSEDDAKRLSLHKCLVEELEEVTSGLNFSRRVEVEALVLEGSMSPERACECAQDVMLRGEPFHSAMRLFCLVSIVYDGVKGHAEYCKELINCYGPEVMEPLKTLERAGLWKSKYDPSAGIGASAIAAAQTVLRGGKKKDPEAVIGKEWDSAKQRLKLVVPDVNLGDPVDIAYTFGGYAPVSVRIAEKALRTPHDKWMSLESSLSAIPGEMFAVTQVAFPPPSQTVFKTVMVFFVGGMTPAETSGVRFAGVCYNGDLPHGGVPVKLLIGATKKSGGARLVESLCEMPVNQVKAEGIRNHNS